MIKKNLFILLGCFSIYFSPSSGQVIDFVADFDFYFDNREFFTSYAPHYTIFGTRVSPALMFSGTNNHSLQLGLTHSVTFGDQTGKAKPDFFGSYLYQEKYFGMELGFIPRKKISMHRFILNDTLAYSRPYLQGMAFWLSSKQIKQSLWIDWVSSQTDTIRESFMIGNNGYWTNKKVFFHHEALLVHHALPALPKEDDHIRDNFSACVTLGYQFSKTALWDTLSVEGGGLVSADRLRSIYNWRTPVGGYISLSFAKAGFGLDISHYQGKPQHTFYGDRFYTATHYTRGDIRYRLFNAASIRAEIKLSLHVLPEGVDFAQYFRLYYVFSTDNK